MTIHKEYSVYNEHFTKEQIEWRVNEFCKQNSADGRGLAQKILWLNVVCEDFDEAKKFIDKLDKYKHTQVAVQYLSGISTEEKPIKEWLIKTQFELKPSLAMDKPTVLEYLAELMNDLESTIPEALIDNTWDEKRKALDIAIKLVKTADENKIEKLL